MSTHSSNSTKETKPNFVHNASYEHLTNKSRCIVPVFGDSDHHRFLVGTHALNVKNEIHLIEYFEDKKSVQCVKMFKHTNEIWSISPHPTESELFWTISNNKKEFVTTLYKMPYNDQNSSDLEVKLDIIGSYAPIINVLWYPDSENSVTDKVIITDVNSVKEWKIEHEKQKSEASNEYKFDRKVFDSKWDPHDTNIVNVASGRNIERIDLRQKKYETLIKNCHENNVKCLDIDTFPNYQICTGGDDGKLKIWDVRKVSEPLRVLYGHSHWITCIKYNPVHDELILTGSTDTLVNLWYAPTICFKETHKDDEETEKDKDDVLIRKDQLIQSIDEHEESVYSLCWSASASWVFASISYDGRVLIHTVPTKFVSEINRA